MPAYCMRSIIVVLGLGRSILNFSFFANNDIKLTNKLGLGHISLLVFSILIVLQ